MKEENYVRDLIDDQVDKIETPDLPLFTEKLNVPKFFKEEQGKSLQNIKNVFKI